MIRGNGRNQVMTLGGRQKLDDLCRCQQNPTLKKQCVVFNGSGMPHCWSQILVVGSQREISRSAMADQNSKIDAIEWPFQTH
jgi:hypothetical protein